MSSDDDAIPSEFCTRPGTITVTRPALDLAQQFQTSVPAGWMVAFIWYDGQRERASKDAPWVDVGPGLGLGTYRTGDIPAEAVYQAGSLRYGVIMQQAVVDRHPEKTIDLDTRGNPVLR
jgi:hypothetical protein